MRLVAGMVGHTVKATKGEVVEVVLNILDNNVAPT